MTPTSVPPAVPSPLIPGLLRVFGDPRFCPDSDVLALAYPSAETICTVEEGGVLRVWDARRGFLRAWRFLSGLETLWAFTPDARLLASAGDEMCLWDTRGGELLGVHAHPGWVTALAFRGSGASQSDGVILATGDDDGVIRVWAEAGARLLRTLDGHRGAVSALAFSPDGARLASAAEDKQVRVWELPTGRQSLALAGHTDRVVDLAWHPRGQHLYSAGWDKTVRVWDAATGNGVTLDHSAPVNALAVRADGQLLAAVDSGGAVRTWDAATHTIRRVFPGRGEEVAHLAFGPAGDTLAVAGVERPFRVLSLTEDPAARTVLPRTATPVPSGYRRNWHSLAVSADGARLAEGGRHSRVTLWEVASGVPLREQQVLGAVHATALSPDGRLFAAGGDDGQVSLWNAATGELLRRLIHEGAHCPVTSLTFLPDATHLAGASAAGTALSLWRLADGEPAWILPDALDGCTVEALAASPDGRQLAAAGIDWLATGGTDGLVLVWDLASRGEVASITWGCTAVAFHPSGRELVLALLDGSLCVWDLEANESRFELTGLCGTITGLAYSPDGQMFATGGDDRFLRLWSAAAGELLTEIEFDTEIKTLTFSPDGRHLFTANANTGVYQLDVRQLLATADPSAGES